MLLCEELNTESVEMEGDFKAIIQVKWAALSFDSSGSPTVCDSVLKSE